MRISVHTSDRTSFKRCRQRWDFSSNLRMNMEPKSPVTPLFFGSNMHAALADYYEPSTPRLPESAVNVFLAKTNKYLDQFDVIDEEKEIWINDQIDLGTGMLGYYFSQCNNLDLMPDTDWQVIWVEKQME